MLLKRNVIMELLGAHRALDGLRSEDKFTAYKFAPEVVDKVVDNIMALKATIVEAESWRDTLAKQLSGDSPAPMGQGHPKWITFVEALNAYMLQEVDMELQAFTKEDLNLKVNYILPSIREALLPVMAVTKMATSQAAAS